LAVVFLVSNDQYTTSLSVMLDAKKSPFAFADPITVWSYGFSARCPKKATTLSASETDSESL
jgi:hypothetical protein